MSAPDFASPHKGVKAEGFEFIELRRQKMTEKQMALRFVGEMMKVLREYNKLVTANTRAVQAVADAIRAETKRRDRLYGPRPGKKK